VQWSYHDAPDLTSIEQLLSSKKIDPRTQTGKAAEMLRPTAAASPHSVVPLQPVVADDFAPDFQR
jgi:hypothetical protein